MTVDNGIATDIDPASKSSGSRRSSRTRKPVSADVFGTITPISGTTRSSAPRQKPGKGPPQASAPGNIVFFTNGVALKNLTNNNTTRNQRYHTTLETLIVRKPGDRPESPTMKLRTIAEKQKEEETRNVSSDRKLSTVSLYSLVRSDPACSSLSLVSVFVARRIGW